ncbi:alpha/beta fold hydrolase [Haladaptatus sp. ZSTT2]|uniref:alpha/beta fold hydrolase n=1 Tax=Haladaptatus sp. ZSTT2 TaxID=3120515 RepID=UPI00300F2E27
MGRGPPLVLVHGTSADHTSWRAISPLLADHVTLYAMIRRGRGESGDAAEYALEREAEDVVALVEAIDQPVVLFGHSFGGLCALEAAVQTNTLCGLILYEPAIPMRGHLYDDEVLAEMQSLLTGGANEQMLHLFLREIAELSGDQIDALCASPAWPSRVKAAHTVLREAYAEEAYVFDPRRFAAVTTPTILLAGGNSPSSFRDATAAVADALPNSRIVTLDGQEHVAYYTNPELFVETVLGFIEQVA